MDPKSVPSRWQFATLSLAILCAGLKITDILSGSGSSHSIFHFAGIGNSAHYWGRVIGLLILAVGWSSWLLAVLIAMQRTDQKNLRGTMTWFVLILLFFIFGAITRGEIPGRVAGNPVWDLALGALIVAATASWIAIQLVRGRFSFRWIKHATLAVGCSAMVCATIYGVTWVQSRKLMKEADAKWASIGRPMPEFVATLKPVEENAKLSEFRDAANPLGFETLYKQMDLTGVVAGSDQPPWKQVLGYLDSVVGADGDAAFSVESPAYLAEHATDFDQLYAVLRDGDAPKWGYDPSDPYHLRVPSFLALRQLGQLGLTDAFRRVSLGDFAAAETTITASLRASEDLARQPTLVALMIRVALEALFAEGTTYLPEDPDAFSKIEAEAKMLREQFLNVIQFEAYAISKAELRDLKAEVNSDKIGYAWSELTNQYDTWRARGSMNSAVLCEVAIDLEKHIRGDLGAAVVDDQLSNNISPFSPGFIRGFSRLNCVLVKLEQASMIRSARSALRDGKTHLTQESVVIPGAKWEAAIDVENKSVSLTLDPIPEWISKKDVADDSFYLTPVNGSKPWKFNGKAIVKSRDTVDQAKIQPVKFDPAR